MGFEPLKPWPWHFCETLFSASATSLMPFGRPLDAQCFSCVFSHGSHLVLQATSPRSEPYSRFSQTRLAYPNCVPIDLDDFVTQRPNLARCGPDQSRLLLLKYGLPWDLCSVLVCSSARKKPGRRRQEVPFTKKRRTLFKRTVPGAITPAAQMRRSTRRWIRSIVRT